jgi:hypothetical protein
MAVWFETTLKRSSLILRKTENINEKIPVMIAILRSAIWTGFWNTKGAWGVRNCDNQQNSCTTKFACKVSNKSQLRAVWEVVEQLEWWVTNPSQRRMEPLGLRVTVAATAPTTVARPTPTGPSVALLLLYQLVHVAAPCMNFGLNQGNTTPTHKISITPNRSRDVKSLTK